MVLIDLKRDVFHRILLDMTVFKSLIHSFDLYLRRLSLTHRKLTHNALVEYALTLNLPLFHQQFYFGLILIGASFDPGKCQLVPEHIKCGKQKAHKDIHCSEDHLAIEVVVLIRSVHVGF